MKYNLARKVLHITMASVALLVGRIPFFYFPLICFAAILFNWLVLPHIFKGAFLYASEKHSKVSRGLLTYPIVLFLLSILFFKQPVFFVIGWSVMAFGDGFSSILGMSIQSKKLPWNPHKSWVGLIAFFVFGASGSLLIIGLLPEVILMNSPEGWVILIAVVVAGVFETIDGFYDDNIVVALISSGLAWSLVSLMPFSHPNTSVFLAAATISIAFSTVAYFFTSLSLSGCLAGFFVAFGSIMGFSFQGLIVLAVFFVISMFITKLSSRHQPKDLRQKARNHINVLANGSVASTVGLISAFSLGNKSQLFIAFTAAFASAFSDTISSEIGTAFGKRFFNILSFQKAEKGKDGAISLEGTMAGLLASGIMALVFYVSESSIDGAIIVLISGFSGNILDSVLGATLQQKGYMNNHSVNFTNTLFATVIAIILSNNFS